MAREMTPQYVAYKYGDLSRWEFRFYRESDDGNDVSHIVTWDTVKEQAFCVTLVSEMNDEFQAAIRVREYAVHDLDDIAPNSKLRDEWADAVSQGIVRGIRATIAQANMQ